MKPLTGFAVLVGLAISSLASLLATAQEAAPLHEAAIHSVLGSAVTGFIQPGYERLESDARLMVEATARLCDAPTPEALTETRAMFGSLVEAWSRIEIIRFGPVVENNRLERIFFFPDRRGIGLRQLQAALSDQDPSVTSADALAGKSVAVQGLGALEYLLYGTDAERLVAGDSFRCKFASAVAQRIQATAYELSAAWDEPDGIARRFSKPHPDDPDFKSLDDGLRALLGVFINSTESLADQRVRPFLGEDAAAAKPKLAPYWRSGLTGRSLEAAFEGLEHLFDVSAMAELLPTDIALEAKAAKFELGNARRAINTPAMPLPEAASDAQARGALQYLMIVIRSLRTIFTERLAAGLGLSAGFSPLDGD